MGVVDEPVEDGVGVGRVTDDLMPFIDRDLAGEEGRAAAVAFFEDLVEVAAAPASRGSRPQSSRMRSWAPLRLRMMRA
jgi:hypothetical protein